MLAAIEQVKGIIKAVVTLRSSAHDTQKKVFEISLSNESNRVIIELTRLENRSKTNLVVVDKQVDIHRQDDHVGQEVSTG